MEKPVAFHGTPIQNLNGTSLAKHFLMSRTSGLGNVEILSFLFNPPCEELPLFFHPPFLLPDMEAAALLLLDSIQSGKKILLYGDRDSDGVCSTVLLTQFLRKEFPKASIQSFTSSQNDAYGLSREAMNRILQSKPDLLITLDFGTSNQIEIEELQSRGISVVVLDHHEIPSYTLPCFLINPKREDSQYPDKKICTAFLVFKFILALQFVRSAEYNKIYYIKEDLFSGLLFRNGIPFEADSSFSLSLAETIHEGELPGNESIPLSNRIFFLQISKIPKLLETQFEASALAGIGTITDMMPLTGENRALVQMCCHYLQLSLQGKVQGNLGLIQILRNLNLRPDKVTSKDLGWGIGPLLNAAGRMGKTELVLELLLTNDEETALSKTKELIKTNEERKERTKRNLFRVERFFLRHPERVKAPIAFCYEPDMEPGVSGIVATRMVEVFGKPAVFITPEHGRARGSIRAYGRENVLDLLNAARDLLDHYGGHPEAGGFSVALEKIPDLEKRFFTASFEWLGDSIATKRPLQSDLLVNPEHLTSELLKETEVLEPTGQGNPRILFSIKDAEPIHLNFLGDGTHVRFRVIGAGSLKFILWRNAKMLSDRLSVSSQVSLWGYLEDNYFQSKSNLQFQVIHFE